MRKSIQIRLKNISYYAKPHYSNPHYTKTYCRSKNFQNWKKRGSVLPSPVPPSNKGTPHWPKITERSAERGTFGGSLLQWCVGVARILLILWIILPMILQTCTKYGKYQFWKFPYLTNQNVNFLLALSDRLFSRDLWYKMKLKNSMKPLTNWSFSNRKQHARTLCEQMTQNVRLLYK